MDTLTPDQYAKLLENSQEQVIAVLTENKKLQAEKELLQDDIKGGVVLLQKALDERDALKLQVCCKDGLIGELRENLGQKITLIAGMATEIARLKALVIPACVDDELIQETAHRKGVE